MIKNRSYSKEIGTIAEQAFILEALKQGFGVSVPIDDNLPYDVLIDNGKKILKIQIKTSQGSGGIYNVNTTKSKNRSYNSSDFDFACVYIEKLNIFYIMPIEEFVEHKGNIRIVEGSYKGRNSKLFERQNAWHILME